MWGERGGLPDSYIERENYHCEDSNHQNSLFLYQTVSHDKKNSNWVSIGLESA
jgi:hypothetical protein